MPLRITNQDRADSIAIDFAEATPETLAACSLDEVKRMLVRRGNRRIELGELFTVDGDPHDLRWELEGDFSAVHGLGAGMRAGEIVVRGNVGRHAGAQMSGGSLEVHGSAGDHLGAELHGGVIRVHGDAGSHVGTAYAGSRRGTSGGTILVDGNVGHELGFRMRRGVIAVAGSAGEYVGLRMLAGSIFIFSKCGKHPGHGMRRGTIGLFGGERPELLPTFRGSYRGPLPALHLIEKHLHSLGFEAARLGNLAGSVELWHGDLLELGRGELLLAV